MNLQNQKKTEGVFELTYIFGFDTFSPYPSFLHCRTLDSERGENCTAGNVLFRACGDVRKTRDSEDELISDDPRSICLKDVEAKFMTGAL